MGGKLAKAKTTETPQNSILFVCGPCNEDDNTVTATSSCRECHELYCAGCARVHSNQKATKTHTLVRHDGLDSKLLCGICEGNDKTTAEKGAICLCIDCDEVLCAHCQNVHSKQKATKSHIIISSSLNSNADCVSSSGDPSQDNHAIEVPIDQRTASSVAPIEDNQRTEVTVNWQCRFKRKHDHITAMPGTSYSSGPGTSYGYEPNTKKMKIIDTIKQTRDPVQPGKPNVIPQMRIGPVQLVWEAPCELFDDHNYQVKYKEVNSSKWAFYSDLSQNPSATLNSLKSGSKYVFQVRMINEERVGPFSELSDEVETIQSAAHHMLDELHDVKRSNVAMTLKRLVLKENKRARNRNEKTRKLVLGDARKTNAKEKTIMLIGATGTGKSTLVDGMINYIMGVNWNDPYRLTLVDLEEDERNVHGNQAVSQTQWITCYTINPLQGSRLDYAVNIIDTPGFGDTRGIERDGEIVEQVRSLFSRDDEKGVLFIDAICFLVKAPDARLTPTQKYIYHAIMSLFGQDIKDNFCMMVTFADGEKPPVLAALTEAKLSCDQYFQFNNSGLFAENVGDNGFSKMFWDMGCESFRTFFRYLTKLETKSLYQTRDVLERRKIIDMTMENLLPKLDAGLNKVEELRWEIRILEDSKTQIEENSDFTYTVTETEQIQIDLPIGQHVTNCLNCHVTCHRDCRIPNDEDKKRCWAMNSEGFCTQCTEKCFWEYHKNTPYIFEYVSVEKQKTYTEKLEKYRHAQNENMTRQKVVERMHEEVNTIENEVLDLMERINECNNILREIALKPDPLTVVEHIELLIESERQEKRPGFQNRISSLEKCRKRATIGHDVIRFKNEHRSIRQQANLCQRGTKSQSRKGTSNVFLD